MKEMLHSKIFIIVLIAVLAVGAAVFLLGGRSDVGKPLDAGTTAEVLEGKAEILLDFGTYSEIQIINGDAGWFAVREGEKKPYKIVDEAGNVLLETKMTELAEPAGDYIMMNNGGKWKVLNTKNLEVTETDLLEASVHRSGKYAAGRAVRESSASYEDQDWYVISLEDGSILYEGSQPLTMPYHEGYILEAAAGGMEGKRIISLESGETVFEAGENESVAGDTDGYWLIWTRLGLKYFLNEDLEPAFGGQLFFNAELSDGLAFGQWIEEGKYTNVGDIPEGDALPVAGAVDVSVRAFNRNYEEMWNYMDAPVKWVGNFGNHLCVWLPKDGTYEYVDVRQDGLGPASYGRSYLSFRDGDDGIMLACAEVVKSSESINVSVAMSGLYGDQYRWGYVDGDGEILIDFGLCSGSLSENGYAVVGNEEGQKALIRINGAAAQ